MYNLDYTMVVDQFTEETNFPDPFWLEYGEKIRAVREAIEAPKSRVGEQIAKGAFNNPVFIVYNRLSPIFASLIALVEYDEIGKAEGKDYFSVPTNQIIILKAFKLLVEDEVKFPYPEEEKKKYEDYRRFFEEILERLSELERQINNGQRFPNLVNSLGIVITQESGKLRGVSGFNIKMDEIRGKVRNYLPQLREIEGGKIFSEIKERIEGNLVNTPLSKE